jgi:hypothetical protein
MEFRNYIRPILAGLVGLGLVVLLIVLAVKLFSGGSGEPLARSVDVTKYATGASSATVVFQGPTVLDADFREVRITVSESQNQIQLIQGYQGHVIEAHTYPSNGDAYEAFLQSLERLNFSKGIDRDIGDYRGFCPGGSRYLYSFNDGSSDLFKYWSTNCQGVAGTFQGQPDAVRQLFVAQVNQDDFSNLSNSTAIAF